MKRGQKSYSRAMRMSPTKSEALLWAESRNRKLDLLKFRQQYPIQLCSLTGKIEFYIADFYCASAHIIIELDGTVHLTTVDYDAARDSYLSALGYHVLRIPNVMVENDMQETLNLIRTFISHML
jgi:very-short-patch-repair endonuclease